ncbi:hypothetical protein SAMN04488120_10598 [Fontimonas thermophila]|uniref:Lipoprotein n=1 Tax=Fontimonas thermophila TaxID=1076937 RepID=A0A1I2J0P1_9GAMM|nr:hypothetical protein SAMN04488120_10598 [Fontimonas thermophila]
MFISRQSFSWRALNFAIALAALTGCANEHVLDQPVEWRSGAAVPVDLAVPHLAGAVGERITVIGVPRQREGRCSGVQPLTPQDWMLTGERHCLWVSGLTDQVRLLDLRPGLSDDPVTVTGRLLRTEQGVYVLRIER